MLERGRAVKIKKVITLSIFLKTLRQFIPIIWEPTPVQYLSKCGSGHYCVRT